jgi:hypothetical protein
MKIKQGKVAFVWMIYTIPFAYEKQSKPIVGIVKIIRKSPN